MKFGESVIGRNELDNKWILEEGLDVSVEVSKVPNVESPRSKMIGRPSMSSSRNGQI